MSNKKKISTSKLILLGVILMCVEIVAFCEYAMLSSGDLSSMYVLLGIPVSLIPVCLGYFNKSKAENTAGGIVFETAMMESGLSDNMSGEELEEEITEEE